ncbi:hypothetical protein shim_18570 [Shimia sp. SK013]|uniref:hypothetical protein n=1 Tax=Shimia sp. SK013 TaxID=1389006 RepID=UPI0006B604B3|nr:hypothetical protein [Shimia sp. SK013]KPA21971.1 hypothetical protein shim_18570 [Shimia sp. SK013]
MKFFSLDRTSVSSAAEPTLKKLSQTFYGGDKDDVSDLPAEGNKTVKDLLHRLQIPINTNTPDQLESDQSRDQGLFLARQERWSDLEDQIRTYDQNRTTTSAGTPLAELMLFGARSDVVRAAEHALLHGHPARGADFFAGIEALEYMLEEHPNSYPLALIVAHMHIDIGWAWRGAAAKEDVRELNREAFQAHFERAETILDRFCPTAHYSPALSAARCALLPGQANPAEKLCAEFEALIALDPTNPRHMRALGNYMLPRWYGDFDQLDLQARRIAARTYDLWGAGAYAWVWFDALLVDPRGLEMVEIEYFLDGVDDALSRRGDQHSANLMAAHLFRSWQHARELYSDNGFRADLAPALREGFDMVVHDHLREIHPLIWGHAEIGFENTSRIISRERLAAKGKEIALHAVAMPFMTGLQNGQTVYFTPDGITQINP